MTTHGDRIGELMKSDDPVIARSAPFVAAQLIEEDRDSTIFDESELQQLPSFCEHMPKEFKMAILANLRVKNIPAECTAVALLANANCPVQALFDVVMYNNGKKSIPTSLYILLILMSGGGKSTIFDQLIVPYREHQDKMEHIFANDKLLYRKELEQYEQDFKAWVKNNGTQPTEPTKPETARYILDKFTLSAVFDILRQQSYCSVMSPEAGIFFNSHAFQSHGGDNSRTIELASSLSSLYSGEELTRNIKGEEAKIRNRRMNMFLLVQPQVIRPILANRMLHEQGFLNRYLLVNIPSYERPLVRCTKDAATEDVRILQAVNPYLNRLRKLFNMPKKRLIRDRIDPFQICTTAIDSDEDALKIFEDWINKNNQTITKQGGRLNKYEGFAVRLTEYVYRIAGTIAAFNLHETIQADDAQCAIDYMEMFIDHRANIDLGVKNMNENLTDGADIMSEWFRRNKDKSFTMSQLVKDGPSSLRKNNITTKQREEILEELIKTKQIIAIESMAKNGRPVIKYQYCEENDGAE